jgi:hypothetical protein
MLATKYKIRPLRALDAKTYVCVWGELLAEYPKNERALKVWKI